MPNTPDGLPSKDHLWKLPSRGTQPFVAALRVGVSRARILPHDGSPFSSSPVQSMLTNAGDIAVTATKLCVTFAPLSSRPVVDVAAGAADAGGAVGADARAWCSDAKPR
jgi:hypothetical protein